MICVVGMGRSGEAAARLALRQGGHVRLLEQRQDAATKERAEILRLLGIEVVLGPHRKAMLDDAQLIIVSPGVSAASEIFLWAREMGVEIIGEMEWAARQFHGKLIAVTGTNGKTTTTALIAHLLNESGIPAVSCGNIGTPLSQVILSGQIPEAAVMETSSFQLETIKDFHPAISVFLNFTPDHLDRHSTLQDYWQAKLRLYENQGKGDWALFHRDLRERLEPLASSRGIAFADFGLGKKRAAITVDGEKITWRGRGTLCDRGDVLLIGDHNVENACAAVAVATLCGVGSGAIASAMRSFRAVDHRLQPVGDIGGVRFINDSKATNADSLAVALKAFNQKVVLIAGGRDKNQDFSPLRPLLQEKAKSILLMGEGAEKMARQWEGASEILRIGNLKQAVELSWHKAQPSGVVLLSPACASFDMFRDYEHRGREFVRCVEELDASGISGN